MSKLVILLYVLTTSFGLILLKWGTNSGLPVSYLNDKIHFNLNPYSSTGLTLYALSFIVYVYLISKYDLGYIIPLLAAFVYVLVFVASFIIFKESFTTVKTLGIVFILAGLVLINLNK